MRTSSFPMDTLNNIVKVHINNLAQSYSGVKFAKVKEFDPEKCRIKVLWHDPNPDVDDYTIVSGWFNYATTMQGRGDDSEGGGELWGHVFTPNINEMIMLITPDANHNVAICIGSIYTDPTPPPTTPDGSYTQSGEWLYKNKSKSYLKYWNNGDVWIKATHNLRAIVDNEADIYILQDANVFVGRNVNANISGNGILNVGGSITINTQGSTIINTGGDTTVNAGGNITANANGSLIANVGGNLTAQASGFADIQSNGTLTLQSNSNIDILARTSLTLYANTDVILASPVAIYAVAPIGFDATENDVVVPPLPLIPIVPPNLARPQAPQATVDPDDVTTANAQEPQEPQDPTTNNITDTGADVNFTDPGLA